MAMVSIVQDGEAEWGVPEPCLLFALFLLSAHFCKKTGRWVRLWLPLQWHQRPLPHCPVLRQRQMTRLAPPALAYAFLQMHQSPGQRAGGLCKE